MTSSSRASAPGRVNLIGEHTDYNGGFVLPMAIPQQTEVMLTLRSDARVEVESVNLGVRSEYVLSEERKRGDWTDYVQGVTRVLAAEGFALKGFEARIQSAVPLGSGLSSSAALEVALMRGLRSLFAFELDDTRLALLAQRVETEFVGAPVGVMDQMASSLATSTHALFLDARSLSWERVAFPSSVELVVINSGVHHSHATGEYRVRRAQCEEAAALLGVASLRDQADAETQLPEPLRRRVRHVVTENQRVVDAVRAMRSGDVKELGRLFVASHASMRDDYEITVPEIDLLVTLANETPHVLGARMTGGGFGGSIVALAEKGHGAQAAKAIAESYEKQSGKTPRVLIP